MYIDKRNSNKVIIVKSFKDGVVMVKDIKTNKRYIVDKCHLKEIKV